MATPAGQVQIYGGAFQDFEGTPLSLGYLVLELSHDENLASPAEQIVGGLKRRITLDTNGNIPTNPPTYLFNNSLLTPSNSYYIVRAFKSDGTEAWRSFQYWSLTTDPTDAGTLIPYNPPGNALNLVSTSRVASFNFAIDGGGSTPSTGAKGQWDVPVNCTITGWTLTADQSGSAVVDVLKSTYAAFPTTASIAGSDKPTLSSVQKNHNLAVSQWTTSLLQGDQIQVNLNSVTTCQRLNLTIRVII
jgi:hypothetical protein